MHTDSDLTALLLEHRLTRFLYEEARLLDEWRLKEWLDLFTDDAVYVVPTTDHPKPMPSRDLTLIHDDRKRLACRVGLLLGERAWAENPMSRTRRVVGNIRLAIQQGDICRMAAIVGTSAMVGQRSAAVTAKALTLRNHVSKVGMLSFI